MGVELLGRTLFYLLVSCVIWCAAANSVRLLGRPTEIDCKLTTRTCRRMVRSEEADQLLVERLRHLRLARSDILQQKLCYAGCSIRIAHL